MQLHRRVRELETAHRAAEALMHQTDPDQVALVTVRLIAEDLVAPRVRLHRCIDRRSPLLAEFAEGTAALAGTGRGAGQLPGTLRATSLKAPGAFIDERSGDLVLPIRADAEIQAVVIVAHTQARRFNPADLPGLDRIAALAGLAMRSTQLYRDQRRRMEQLTDTEHTKSQFLSLASHELRGPMTVLMGYLSLLEDGAFGEVPPEFAATFPVLNGRLAEMEGLINGMLETSRLEANRLQLDPGLEDLRQVADEAVRRCEVFLHDGQHISLRCPDDAVLVHVDRGRMTLVVANLVQNAIKYSVQHTDVACEVSANGSSASVAVTDHGIGIAVEDLPVLFTRFGRIRRDPAVSGIPGTGLGLFLARELAQAHQGDISVASSAGSGSTFTLTLPLTPEG